MDRRGFLKFVGISAGLFIGSVSFSRDLINIPKPSPKSPRVVVVGAGWSGLTVAKYIKKGNPSVDVVLVDKRAHFFSCPVSNLWLVDIVPLEMLVHSYLKAADTYGYHFLQATVIDIDRNKRKVYTDKGVIDYDFLVLAPGIDYDYERWNIKDPKELEIARTKYPPAFIPGSEHIYLKRKIHNFEGGEFLVTVPPGLDYRCIPGPYERATLIAWFFKKNKVKGKVILVDPHSDPPVKAKGFHYAWDKIVKGYIDYYPNADIKYVDVINRKVRTEVYGDIDFTDGNIYPPCRVADIVYKIGGVKKGERWANIDPLKYNLIGDERVFISGDARNQPFSKSGNTAVTEAKYVARRVLASIEGKDIPYKPPMTLCYSAVDGNKAVWVRLTYKYENGQFSFASVRTDEKPSQKNFKAYIAWAKAHYKDMLAADL